LGAFVADKKIMDAFTHDPVLGHINTFGGHPVCCAAGLAAFNVLLDEKLIEPVLEKEKLFLSLLKHPRIKKVNSCGLMMAVEFESFEINKHVIDGLLQESGRSRRPDLCVFTDWFLFASNSLRIVPPLTISEAEIEMACHKIITVLDSI
jgi:acetylornithine/succinyldiaminopimelate/putrescine aminotransferase